MHGSKGTLPTGYKKFLVTTDNDDVGGEGSAQFNFDGLPPVTIAPHPPPLP